MQTKIETEMNKHGGKRAGAGRKIEEPSRSMRIPESMVRAAQALQSLAKGKGTQRDIGEIMIAINADGRVDQWGGVVGWEEIRRAVGQANNAAGKGFDPELMADAEDLEARAKACGI